MKLDKTEKLETARTRLRGHYLATTRHRATKLVGAMAALRSTPGDTPSVCETPEFDAVFNAIIALVPKLRPYTSNTQNEGTIQ